MGRVANSARVQTGVILSKLLILLGGRCRNRTCKLSVKSCRGANPEEPGHADFVAYAVDIALIKYRKKTGMSHFPVSRGAMWPGLALAHVSGPSPAIDGQVI